MKNSEPDEHTETNGQWSHESREEFVDYYAKESLSPQTEERFRQQRALILQLLDSRVDPAVLRVADIGGGAGSLAMIWAETTSRVRCLDINARLIEIGRNRAERAGLPVEFEIGSATDLPWPDECLDVCLAPELLEHVEDWQQCLNEFGRVLSPGGLLFLSTTNALCPVQQEFNLPLYAWYPGPLKRRYERLAKTLRPELANYATYPAVNWFTFYGLRKTLRERGFDAFYDRFDLARLAGRGALKDLILAAVCRLHWARGLAHCCSAGTTLVARKAGAPPV